MTTVSYLTQEGYDRIKAELDQLKTTGDLSENAEYHAAKDAQGMLEMKINDLEKKIMNVRILDLSHTDTSKVTMMTHVRLKNHNTGKEITYLIVPEAESDIKVGKLSVNSPIGHGLLGKVVGEKAVIKIPAGEMILEILEITA
jgi:transcription elongation factor GreA